MMRIDLWDFYNSRVFAEYKTFKIDGERDGYKLTATNYSGEKTTLNRWLELSRFQYQTCITNRNLP